MSISISTYPGTNSTPDVTAVKNAWLSDLPEKLVDQLGLQVKFLSYDLKKQEIKNFSLPCSFSIDSNLPLSLLVGLFLQSSNGKRYILDELNEVIEYEGKSKLLFVGDEPRFWKIMNEHKYFINILSTANRDKNEAVLMLNLACSFAQTTDGYVFVRDSPFFKVPYGIYEWRQIRYEINKSWC